MPRFPSGITPLPGANVDDVRTRAVRLALAMDEQPLGASAPCMNPECDDPVDFIGTGALNLYCSTTCRSRASTLRGIALQQLATVEHTLADAHYMHGIPRDDLRRRARQLRCWLARMATADERLEALEDHHDHAEGERAD